MNGKVLKEATAHGNTSLSMGADLQRGLYILKVIRGNTVTRHRLVKN
ncbi:MAG: T9SS type A sorting domain-containing protein [Bacteroidota bacterium]